MGRSTRRLTLQILKAAGAFSIARYLTRRGLRILCYHGWSEADEHQFNPIVFMRDGTFRSRMAMLARCGYPVISLDDALAGNYPDGATVITIDDGWRTTATIAAPVLREHGFPATLYVATYYVEKRAPVFNVLVRYVVAMTSETRVDLPQWGIAVEFGDRKAAASEIVRLTNGRTLDEHNAIAADLCRALTVDATEMFRYCSPEELRALQAQGVDIQLHTHRHRSGHIEQEIADNRAALSRIVPRAFQHFCYPGGNLRDGKHLAALGIVTAMTDERGLSFAGTDPLRMPRFMDADNLSNIEVEAEMCGLMSILRERAIPFRKQRFGLPSR